MSNVRRLATLAVSMALVGCKAKDEPASGSPAELKPSYVTSPEGKPVDARLAVDTNPTPQAGSAAIASEDEYRTLAIETTRRLTAIFTAAKTDCTKLAADLRTFDDETRATARALTVYEAEHPHAQSALAAKVDPDHNLLEKTFGPMLKACTNNKAFRAVMDKRHRDQQEAENGPDFGSDQEYEAKADELHDQMTSVFASDGADCATLTTELGTFARDHEPMIRAVRRYAAEHAGARRRFAAAKDMEDERTLDPVLKACRNHPALAEVTSRLPL